MVNSSLGYEILLYLNSFYFGMFAACEIGMGLLKAVNLPYKENTIAIESTILVIFIITETVRIYLGRKGNLSEHNFPCGKKLSKGIPVCISIFLTIPSALVVVFLLFFQTHKLRLEYILCALLLALQMTELVFAIMFVFTMCRPPSYD